MSESVEGVLGSEVHDLVDLLRCITKPPPPPSPHASPPPLCPLGPSRVPPVHQCLCTTATQAEKTRSYCALSVEREDEQRYFESRRLWTGVTKGIKTSNQDMATEHKTKLEDGQRAGMRQGLGGKILSWREGGVLGWKGCVGCVGCGVVWHGGRCVAKRAWVWESGLVLGFNLSQGHSARSS